MGGRGRELIRQRGCEGPPSIARADQGGTDAYQRALAAHWAGDLETAARLYQELLRENPNHAGAWHFLGVIGFSRRHDELARGYMERAAELCPEKPVYWNNYGAYRWVRKRLDSDGDGHTDQRRGIADPSQSRNDDRG